MTLPAKIISDKPGKPGRLRCPAHLKFVRSHRCCVPHCDRRPIEAAHVRAGTDPQALGSKPGDNWTISLCSHHHAEQHRIGEHNFGIEYNLSMKALAEEFWAKSPHRRRAEAAQRKSA